MGEPYAPDGFNRAAPCLSIEGAHAVVDFIANVFDGEVLDRVERGEGTLAHAAVGIGDSVIELSEATERFGPMPAAIHVHVPDASLFGAERLSAADPARWVCDMERAPSAAPAATGASRACRWPGGPARGR